MADFFGETVIRITMAAASIALTRYQRGRSITPDGKALMSRPRPEPFHLRWLLPTVLRGNVRAWEAVSYASLCVAAALFPGPLWACALFVSLPWFRCMAQAPVLVDAPAFALALSLRRLTVPAAVGTAYVLGLISERAPIFAALFASSSDGATAALYAVSGLSATATVWKFVESAPRRGDGAWKTGHKRAMRFSSFREMVLPWGAGAAALLAPDWTTLEVLTVAVAYGQLLVAWDNSRLYQWAAPVVLPKAIGVVPARWRVLAVVVTWANPYVQAGRGGVVT